MDGRGQRSIRAQLDRIPYLRATGPNPFDYFLWADHTSAIVRQVFGAAAQESVAFEEAVRESGRTIDQRGIFDNMTLGLHGEWGIWARLDRAQGILEQILARYPATSH
ncbi:MAG: hypothetical protein ACR2PL_02705 [Dehalococcoidia bacterium]